MLFLADCDDSDKHDAIFEREPGERRTVPHSTAIAPIIRWGEASLPTKY